MLTTQELHDYLDPYYYGIRASWALAVAIAFLFACVTLAHLVLLLLRRAWFLIPLAIGALVETTGYGFRAEGLREVVPKPSTYVTSSTLIIIAPAFMTASLYQLLARMALVSGRATSKRLALKLGLGFGLGALDVLSYALQAAGAAKLQYGPFGPPGSRDYNLISTLNHSRSLSLAGNVINLLTLLIFLLATSYTHLSLPKAFSAPPPGIRRLYLCILLLLIRTFFRVVAYSRGLVNEYNPNKYTNPLKINPVFREGWMYGFDTLMTFTVLVVIAVWYPTRDSLGEADAGEGRGRWSGRNRSSREAESGAGERVRMEGMARDMT